MEIYVTNLIIEVTRRCNMCCRHCLRGDSQNLDIDRKTIKDIISNIDAISSITFTGGEPTLNLDAIRFFFEEADRQNKLPEMFWLATNGKANQLELAQILLQWYPKMEDKECCGVAVSEDPFHESNKENIMKGLVFYDDSKTHSTEDKMDWVINKGNAKHNGIGRRNYCSDPSIDVEYAGEDYISVNSLYVSVNGNVIGDCDYTYDEIDAEAITNVQNIRNYLLSQQED